MPELPFAGYLLRSALVLTLFAPLGFTQAILQTPGPADWQTKLHFHVLNTVSPAALAESVVVAGYLQVRDSPKEWGRTGLAYGERLGSTMAFLGVRNGLGFGLDTVLHQDPRYYRSGQGGFRSRAAHAIAGTILTRTDSGRETFATWRFGSAYGAAFLTNEWQPGRLNTIHGSLAQGSAQIGFDVLQNLGAEFWPDVRRKMFHR